MSNPIDETSWRKYREGLDRSRVRLLEAIDRELVHIRDLELLRGVLGQIRLAATGHAETVFRALGDRLGLEQADRALHLLRPGRGNADR